MRVKDRVPTAMKSNLVYRVPCSCGKVYIGETIRRLETRIKEHEEACKKWLPKVSYCQACMGHRPENWVKWTRKEEERSWSLRRPYTSAWGQRIIASIGMEVWSFQLVGWPHSNCYNFRTCQINTRSWMCVILKLRAWSAQCTFFVSYHEIRSKENQKLVTYDD